MGNSNGKDKSNKLNNEEEYMRMLKRRRQRALEKHEKEAHDKGKAYQELQR